MHLVRRSTNVTCNVEDGGPSTVKPVGTEQPSKWKRQRISQLRTWLHRNIIISSGSCIDGGSGSKICFC